MKLFNKAAVALAVVTLVASPIVASAAPALDVRALSAIEDENSISPALIVLGLALVVGLIVIVSDDDPSSP